MLNEPSSNSTKATATSTKSSSANTATVTNKPASTSTQTRKQLREAKAAQALALAESASHAKAQSASKPVSRKQLRMARKSELTAHELTSTVQVPLTRVERSKLRAQAVAAQERQLANKEAVFSTQVITAAPDSVEHIPASTTVAAPTTAAAHTTSVVSKSSVSVESAVPAKSAVPRIGAVPLVPAQLVSEPQVSAQAVEPEPANSSVIVQSLSRHDRRLGARQARKTLAVEARKHIAESRKSSGRRANRAAEKKRAPSKRTAAATARHEHIADFHPQWAPTESIPVITAHPRKVRSHSPNPSVVKSRGIRRVTRTPLGHLRNGIAASFAISALVIPLPTLLVAEAATGDDSAQPIVVASSASASANPQTFNAAGSSLTGTDLGYEVAKWKNLGLKITDSTVSALEGKTIPAATKIYLPLSPWTHITSDFGPRSSPCSGCSYAHKGIDVKASVGTSVVSIAAGIVIETGSNGTMGNFINVVHYIDGTITVTHYQHLSKIGVEVGQTVKGGEQIGLSGETGVGTGPHLHFEVEEGTATYDSTWAHSVDPDAWLAKHVKGFKRTTDAPWTYNADGDSGTD